MHEDIIETVVLFRKQKEKELRSLSFKQDFPLWSESVGVLQGKFFTD